MPSMSLQGKVAIVTGGGVGIGYGIAQRLAEEGAKVVLAQRRGERAEQAAAELTAQGATCLGLATDVTQRGRVQELVATAREWGGGLDILVNNAGISGMAKFSSFMELSDELWDSVMAVNSQGRVSVLAGSGAADDRAALRKDHSHLLGHGAHR